MVYYVLGRLESLGLVIADDAPGRKTIFHAEGPEKLEALLEEREKEIARQKETLRAAIGDLRSVYNLAHNKPGVRFFEGPEGIREVTFDSLKAEGEIYTFADMEAVETYAKTMNADYVKERLKKKISKKLMVLDTPYTRERYRAAPPSAKLLEVRLLPPALSPFQTGMQIYNNTISYSTLTAEKQIGVIIADEQIARMHRSLFDYIWGTLPPLPITSETPAA
jgi:sugar-specific transcriptional regulator TrmB